MSAKTRDKRFSLEFVVHWLAANKTDETNDKAENLFPSPLRTRTHTGALRAPHTQKQNTHTESIITTDKHVGFGCVHCSKGSSPAQNTAPLHSSMWRTLHKSIEWGTGVT
ncbi:MAG: hypothetical protein DRQ56_09995 [Gammaproteobacteria bacterium]|nr:MAG: hypothetical protein DRQ56_09995 [Gammaproteobacteria bacterium]